MSLFQLRSIVALHAGKDIHANSARIKKIMQRRTAKWLDESFFELLKKLEADNFLECGARDAKASQRFVESIGSKAVAAEANPLTWQEITKKAERNGVVTINCGVGPNENDTLDFFMPEDHRMASNASFMRKTGQHYVTQKIKTRTIDGLYREHFSEQQSMALWIDVEGMAMEVLKGARQLLETGRCVALKVEVETRRHWIDQHLASDIDAYLGAYGYRPVLCDFEYDHQFNVIYVKGSATDAIERLIGERLFALSRSRVSVVERFFKSRKYFWRNKR